MALDKERHSRRGKSTYELCSLHTENVKASGVWMGDCHGLLHWADHAAESYDLKLSVMGSN